MRPLGIVLRGRFFFVTTLEKKNGFLLIETFRKLFNPQNYGHLDQLRVAIYYLSGNVKRVLCSAIDHANFSRTTCRTIEDPWIDCEVFFAKIITK